MVRTRLPVLVLGIVGGCFSESDSGGDGDPDTGSAGTSTTSAMTSATSVDTTASSSASMSGPTTDPTSGPDDTSSSESDPDTTGGCESGCSGMVQRVIGLPLLLEVEAIANDDLVIFGSFGSDITLLGEALANPGGIDLVLARIVPEGPNGELVWLRQWEGSAVANIRGLAVSGMDHIALACAYEGSLSIDTGGLPTTMDGEGLSVGVGVYDADGVLLESHAMQGITDPFGGIDIDTSDRVLVSATFAGALIVPGEETLESAGVFDGALWAFQVDNGSGYATRMGGSGRDAIHNLAYLGLELGPARVVGELSGSIQLDGVMLTAQGDVDAFVGATDVTGGWTWARRIGGDGPDLARGIAVDPAGATYVFGHFEGNLVPEPGEGEPVDAVGASDLVLSKYDIDGGLSWRRVWGGAGEEQARDLIFVDGAVVGVGEFRGSTSVDGVEVVSSGGTDGLVIAVDADGGDLRWVAAFGDDGDDRALSITATDDGVWAAIAIQGEVEIDGTTVGTAGSLSTALTLIGL
jgi:hypothetical protein